MGQEFRVNSYQSNWQRNPTITALHDGGFVIGWESYLNNYNDGPEATYVAMQRYSASGQRLGGETLINGVDQTVSSHLELTTLRDGGIAAVFAYDNYDAIMTTDMWLYAQVFNANGTERCGLRRVDNFNASMEVALPNVQALANGGFVVTYASDSSNAHENVYSRAFAASGTPTLAPRVLTVNDQLFNSLETQSTQLRDGRTLVIWNYQSMPSNEIHATFLDSAGRPLRQDFALMRNIGATNSDMGLGFDVAALASGGFVVSTRAYGHTIGSDLHASPVMRFFNASGQATSGLIAVRPTEEIVDMTRVTQLDDGRIVIVWQQGGEGEIGDDVYARVYDSRGRALSRAFEVGVDADSYDDQTDPQIAALRGGGFVITYTSDSIDNDDEGIAARIFGRGTAGNDRLGVDASGGMSGLAGNDTIRGNGLANRIDGGGGHDVIEGLNGADQLLGGAGNDRLSGGDGNDLLSGGTGTDRLSGGNGNDTLRGDAGDDRLAGGAGEDWLSGGTGRDFLSGGAGRDHFQFTTRPSGTTNIDHIADFAHGDRIELSRAAFAGLGNGARLGADQFKLIGTGGSAVDANDRILYDRAHGVLYYDSNGSAAGGRVQIAVLDNHAALSASDIFLI